MILIESLTVSYTKKERVIDNLNLTLEENTIHGIVGLNGSGKTTLLDAIYGLNIPDFGTVKIGNQKLNKWSIAYLVTENFFYSNITAREYLSLFKGKDFDVEKWNELFALPLDKIIDGYSTGMKKKLAILSILKQNKSILILDEPFNGLDLETCRVVRTILLKLKEKGKTIIITSHILETLTNLCDNLYFLENGQITHSSDKSGFQKFQQDIFSKIEFKTENTLKDLI